MNKLERMKEILKASPNFGKGADYKMCVVDELHDMKELENIIRNQEETLRVTLLEEEKKAKKIAELEKELEKRVEQIEALNKDKDYFSDALDKQIEATLKLHKENEEKEKRIAEQKEINADLKQSLDWANERESEDVKCIEYAKTIIQDLLNNSDEYARQRAIDWLQEN